jgi:hypothetical protein
MCIILVERTFFLAHLPYRNVCLHFSQVVSFVTAQGQRWCASPEWQIPTIGVDSHCWKLLRTRFCCLFVLCMHREGQTNEMAYIHLLYTCSFYLHNRNFYILLHDLVKGRWLGSIRSTRSLPLPILTLSSLYCWSLLSVRRRVDHLFMQTRYCFPSLHEFCCSAIDV